MISDNKVREQLAEIGITGIPARQDGFKAAAQVLDDDERIYAAITGTYEGLTGAAIATDRRVLFVGRSTGLFKKLRTEQFPYSSIASIEVKHGKLFPEVTVIGSGNSAKIEKATMGNPAGTQFGDVVRQRMAAAKSGPTVVVTGAGVDVADQIRKLAELRDQGVLTDAEFQAQKTKLLS